MFVLIFLRLFGFSSQAAIYQLAGLCWDYIGRGLCRDFMGRQLVQPFLHSECQNCKRDRIAICFVLEHLPWNRFSHFSSMIREIDQ